MNKPEPLARGCIRLAIRDKFAPHYSLITYESLRNIIDTNLRTRLGRYRIPDVDEIIDSLLLSLVGIQSVISMSI